MIEFDPGKLRTASQSLPEWKRVAFMAVCCERMLINYASFSADSGSGDVSALRQALDVIWKWVETDRSVENIDDLVAMCDSLAPNTSEFGSVYTSAALDATNAIAIALEALSGATQDRMIEVASLARDSVDVFVQQQNHYDPNATDLESLILDNPLMQQELARQVESLAYLKDQIDNRSEVIRSLQLEWSMIKKGSLPFVENWE